MFMLTACISGEYAEHIANGIALWGVAINAIIMTTGVITIFIAAIRTKQQNSLSLYEKYTARYQHIMEHMPEEFFRSKVENIESQEKEKINHYIRMYIDLCSEEYFLYKEGCIIDSVWGEWRDGILGMFEKPLVKEYWIDNIETYESDYKQFYTFISDHQKKTNNEL